MKREVRGERGGGTLLALGVAMVLLGAGVAAALWAVVSVGNHRAAAAADLAALSAAEAARAGTGDPCTSAQRIAVEQEVMVQLCRVDGEEVFVVVGVPLRLGSLGSPVVTAEARAGPVSEDGRWRLDG
jgi:secretion/DNA translocation related TadE-like protein